MFFTGLYTVYMWTLIVFAVLVFGLTLAVLLPVARKGPLYRLIVSGWGRFIVRCSGVGLELRGFDRVDPSRPYIYMSNHQSYFDVICLLGYLPHPARFVAKKELVYIPIFGQLMWGTGHIVINRASREQSVAELKKAAKKIQEGTSILVFPEGTRSPDHKLGPFKKGGFMLAMEAKVPVVPVSVSGTAPMMPKGGYTFKRTHVVITLGEPIPTHDLCLENREEFMDRVRAAIIRNFPEDSPEWRANQGDPSLERFPRASA